MLLKKADKMHQMLIVPTGADCLGIRSLMRKAVCRAGLWGDRSRCAIRMTEKGSATAGMACGDRPVKSNPQHGTFPAVGTPSSRRLANHPSRPRAERTEQVSTWLHDAGRMTAKSRLLPQISRF